MTSPLSAPAPRWARAAVLIVAALALSGFGAGLVVRVQQLTQVCVASAAACDMPGHVTPAAAAALASAGLSLADYAALQVGKWLFFAAIWFVVGGLIFVRKSHEWVALASAYFLLTFPTQWDGLTAGLADVFPRLTYPLAGLRLVVSLGMIFFLAVFPNGRFEPRWVRWFPLVWCAGIALDWLPASGPTTSWKLAALLISLSGLGGMVVAQIIRYRRYSTPAERDRTRWVIYGLVMATIGLMLIVGISLLGEPAGVNAPGTVAPTTPLNTFAGEIAYQVAVALIPISIGIAILRSRLWDIDLIIRRTLVYGALSGLLALLYFGSVVVFESLLRGLTGSGSQAAIVLSTLLIAALFGPLRARVQRAIDRRFYRRKYDAARTLAAFGASVRDDVDLDALGQRLTAVVDDTMQPASISLWAPAPAPRKPHDAAR